MICKLSTPGKKGQADPNTIFCRYSNHPVERVRVFGFKYSNWKTLSKSVISVCLAEDMIAFKFYIHSNKLFSPRDLLKTHRESESGKVALCMVSKKLK